MLAKRFFLILLVCGLFNKVTAQDLYLASNNDYFQPVFNTTTSGNFKGTVNGVIFIENSQRVSSILDFQGSKASLNLVPDEDEVYDIHTKIYTGDTTSGRSKIVYKTYAMANHIELHLPSGTYWMGGIDGACDMIVDGLTYFYRSEKNTEYLILRVKKKIMLRNLDDSGENITLLPESVLVFAIARNIN